MNAACAWTRERAPELALGILDGDERAEVLAHLAECAQCQAVVDEHSEVADLLPQLAPAADPPSGFEHRVVRAFTADRRRTRRRLVAAVAAALAAATITSIAVVRVIDADRGEEHAAPSLRTVAMVGTGGTKVGRVTVSTGTPAAVAVNVDYAVPDGKYSLILRGDGADRVLGSVTITGGAGEWSGRARVPNRSGLTVALVDADGATVCKAHLVD